MIMGFGDVVTTTTITDTRRSPAHSATISFRHVAPGRVKGRHTKQFVFCYLGLEDIGTPLSAEQFERRLNDLGWQKMTETQWSAHLKKRKREGE